MTSGRAFMKFEDVEDSVSEKPGYVVFDVPVSMSVGTFGGKTNRPPVRVLHPVLAVRTRNGDVLFPDEALAWARSLCEAETLTPDIRRKLNSVGRLWEFAETTVGPGIAEPEVIDMVVCQYLLARAETPVDPSARTFPHWVPVRLETVSNEFRDIQEFAAYCAAFKADASIIGRTFQSSSLWSTFKKKMPAQDFLSHLGVERARWKELLDEDTSIALPRSVRRRAINAKRSKKGNTTALHADQIAAIVDRENNIMFRALWILLAFCGPRVSEALNLWICDILSAGYARRLFGTDIKGPVVVFADPRASTYTGSFDPGNMIERETFLKRRYGLRPKPDAEGRKQRAGWKGMLTFNQELLITHGTWIDEQRAAEFADLVTRIRALHGDLGTQTRHPYLFVNSVYGKHCGAPTKIGNVEKAFARALERAGIERGSPGAHLHGFRHYYAWFAEHELGMSEKDLQLMLRQVSPLSQREYGKRASDINNKMTEIMTIRKASL